MEDIKQIIVGFFKSLKCEISETSNSLIIKKIPEKVWKAFGISESVEINFVNNGYGIFIDTHSDLYRKIKDYLKTNPSKTLLKIDFEFPSNIREMIPLRNCSVAKIEKKHENNYFSRFTILTTFRYLNKIEQVLNEIYVHEGKIVQGDLKDYDVKEGKVEEASTEHLAADYDVAKQTLHDLIDSKVNEISLELDEELNKEIQRIEEHYSSILGEFNLNKSRLFERIKEAELSGEEEKLKKLNEMFKNNFSEQEFQKILGEKKSIIDNEKMKFSLDVENKLINTTIIYYPVFRIYLSLDEAGFKKSLEVVLNPLTQEITNFACDSCKSPLEQINVCHGGHICCKSCLYVCSECGKRFCRLCMAGVCNSCGKIVCKSCARECEDCKKLFCKNCMRISSITGKEKCNACVVYCPKCSKIVEKSNLTRDSSGAMVCKRCGVGHRRVPSSSSEAPIRKLTSREIFGE